MCMCVCTRVCVDISIHAHVWVLRIAPLENEDKGCWQIGQLTLTSDTDVRKGTCVFMVGLGVLEGGYWFSI